MIRRVWCGFLSEIGLVLLLTAGVNCDFRVIKNEYYDFLCNQS
jgi:hypothetical protein